MPKKNSLGKMKVSFALVIIIICLVATAVAVYWIKTETPEQAPQTIKSDPTANWQVYKNEKYGFEVKYPGDWFTKSCGNEFISFSDSEAKLPRCFTDLPQPVINIKIYSNKTNLDKFSDYPMNSLENSVKSNILLNNIPARRISGRIKAQEGPGFSTGTKIISAIFAYQQNAYQIYYAESDNKDLSSVFDQILSTFKFTK